MKYDVNFYDDGVLTGGYCGLNKAQAIQAARQAARQGGRQVFIEWYRKCDGQHGFLNPSGHDITGKAW